MSNHLLNPIFLFLILISCDPFKTQRGEDLPLIGTRWELSSIHYIFKSPIHVQKGEYTILFSDTGTVQSKVDCNACFGEFILDDKKSISIQLGICTEVYCGADSKDNDFHDAIKNTTRYTINGNTLKLFFENNFLYFLGKTD
ncbi:META domain-containing protein [bacterium]|nr:META domain-containing protein [bacterium]